MRNLGTLFTEENAKTEQSRLFHLISVELFDGSTTGTSGIDRHLITVANPGDLSVGMGVTVTFNGVPVVVITATITAINGSVVTLDTPVGLSSAPYTLNYIALLNIVDSNYDITYNGVTYQSFPVRFGEMTVSSDGTIDKATLSVANVSREITYYVEMYNGLSNRKVTVKTVYEKFLDNNYYLKRDAGKYDSHAFYIKGDTVVFDQDGGSYTCILEGTNPMVVEADSGVPVTFTRSTIAYNPDGSQVTTSTPRYGAGKWAGNAIQIEEGTTNLLPVNAATVETDLTGFGFNLCTGTRDTSLHWQGSACVKTVATSTGGGNGPYVYGIAVTAGQTYTFSCYVRNGSTRSIYPAIEWKTGSGNNGTTTGTATVLPGNVWTRISVTGTAPAGTVTATVTCYTGSTGAVGDTFWTDGFQLEQKPYPTSFITGSRAAEVLSIPANVCGPLSGSLQCWVYLTSVAGSSNNIIATNGSYGADGFYLWVTGSTLQFIIGNGTIGVYMSHPTLMTTGWHHIAVSWSPSGAVLYRDGVPFTSAVFACVPNIGGTLKVGSDGFGRQLNGYLDDLCIFSEVLTPAQVLSSYQSGTYPVTSKLGTYAFRFENSPVLNKGTINPAAFIPASPEDELVSYCPNPAKDSSACIEDAFVIDSYSYDENVCGFTLDPAVNLSVKLPRRKFYPNSCQWKYRDAHTCKYTGPDPVGQTGCSKTLSACKSRGNQARYGAFPGINGNRRVWF